MDLSALPEGEEVLGILRNEKVPLNYWVDLAVSINVSNALLSLESVKTFIDMVYAVFLEKQSICDFYPIVFNQTDILTDFEYHISQLNLRYIF